MTKAETAKFFAMISALYPRDEAFANATPEIISVWAAMLADVPFSVAQAGLQAHACTSPFPPAVSDIKGWLVKFQDDYMDASEAWGLARKAISKYGFYNKTRAKEHLPPEVFAVMERMGYEDMCLSENPDVIRGQFVRLYEANRNRKKEIAQLPPQIREQFMSLQSGMALEAGRGNI